MFDYKRREGVSTKDDITVIALLGGGYWNDHSSKWRGQAKDDKR